MTTKITITLSGPKKERLIFSAVLRAAMNFCMGYANPSGTVSMCVQQTESKS